MPLITYLRPSGTTIEVNDTPETRALAEANGWIKQNSEAVKKTTPKKSK